MSYVSKAIACCSAAAILLSVPGRTFAACGSIVVTRGADTQVQQGPECPPDNANLNDMPDEVSVTETEVIFQQNVLTYDGSVNRRFNIHVGAPQDVTIRVASGADVSFKHVYIQFALPGGPIGTPVDITNLRVRLSGFKSSQIGADSAISGNADQVSLSGGASGYDNPGACRLKVFGNVTGQGLSAANYELDVVGSISANVSASGPLVDYLKGEIRCGGAMTGNISVAGDLIGDIEIGYSLPPETVAYTGSINISESTTSSSSIVINGHVWNSDILVGSTGSSGGGNIDGPITIHGDYVDEFPQTSPLYQIRAFRSTGGTGVGRITGDITIDGNMGDKTNIVGETTIENCTITIGKNFNGRIQCGFDPPAPGGQSFNAAMSVGETMGDEMGADDNGLIVSLVPDSDIVLNPLTIGDDFHGIIKVAGVDTPEAPNSASLLGSIVVNSDETNGGVLGGKIISTGDIKATIEVKAGTGTASASGFIEAWKATVDQDASPADGVLGKIFKATIGSDIYSMNALTPPYFDFDQTNGSFKGEEIASPNIFCRYTVDFAAGHPNADITIDNDETVQADQPFDLFLDAPPFDASNLKKFDLKSLADDGTDPHLASVVVQGDLLSNGTSAHAIDLSTYGADSVRVRDLWDDTAGVGSIGLANYGAINAGLWMQVQGETAGGRSNAIVIQGSASLPFGVSNQMVFDHLRGGDGTTQTNYFHTFVERSSDFEYRRPIKDYPFRTMHFYHISDAQEPDVDIDDKWACHGGILADIDNDGDVDSFDFLTFSNCFNGSLNPPNPPCTGVVGRADLDLDGDVDNGDFLTFSNQFQGSLPTSDGPVCDHGAAAGSSVSTSSGDPYDLLATFSLEYLTESQRADFAAQLRAAALQAQSPESEALLGVADSIDP